MTLQQLETGLFVSLGVTVVVLLGAIWLAHKHRPKAHIGGVIAFLVSFLVTLYFAENVGRLYDFHGHASYYIHLTIAIFTAVTVVVPLATGYRHWKGSGTRELHKQVVWAWGVCVGLSLVTGVWMLSNGTPK